MSALTEIFTHVQHSGIDVIVLKNYTYHINLIKVKGCEMKE